MRLKTPRVQRKKATPLQTVPKATAQSWRLPPALLCKYNLVHNGSNIPVVYFTELLAEALGVKEDINA